ncbi:MAG: RsmE family RNA methyltransferase [Candidatus Taylorbacteria bacterium]|nr:RsmE family RNA methyltransferase [Candidatus Taylorbacteria bacterium]
MKIHRFLVKGVFEGEQGRAGSHVGVGAGIGANVSVRDEAIYHQIKDVLRLRAGETVIFFDNSGLEYFCKINSFDGGFISVTVEKVSGVAVADEKVKICLCASLIKKDNYEWVLEKGTELGVSAFQPVISARTEKKDLNMERAVKIVTEASEQSGRVVLPLIKPVSSLEKILSEVRGSSAVAFHLFGEKFDKGKILGGANGTEELCVFIGPEGGWTNEEIDLFKKNNVPVYTLGDLVLKAETAGIVSAALLLL